MSLPDCGTKAPPVILNAVKDLKKVGRESVERLGMVM